MISVEHLTKYYGDHLAVDDISFEITEGHVYGFLGPNGAGKSTTMNIITGCLSATEGRVLIDGHDIFEEPDAAKRCIGYLPEQPPLYMNESPWDYLRFVGEAKGLRGGELMAQVQSVIEKTGIDQVKHRRISQLSKGYKQRVGIAQALLGNPKVIILDEPTVGLDPRQLTEIRELIRTLGEEHTVILSSHILSEVQAVCQTILILSKGKLVACDTPKNLEKLFAGTHTIELTAEGTEEEIRSILSQVEGVGQPEITGKEDLCEITLTPETEGETDLCRALFFAFAQAGHAIVRMHTSRASLEDVFLELTQEKEEQE